MRLFSDMSKSDRSRAISEVRSAVNIVDVVGEHVELRKSGAEFKGLCPFHDENTASFTVNDSKGVYHCFGCRAGGDAFDFVKDYHNVDFAGAMDILLARLNILI